MDFSHGLGRLPSILIVRESAAVGRQRPVGVETPRLSTLYHSAAATPRPVTSATVLVLPCGSLLSVW